MLEADTIIVYPMAICWVDVNASDVIYSAYFFALFICSRIPSVCLLNDFNEVYSYLWMAVYMSDFIWVKHAWQQTSTPDYLTEYE